MDVPYPIVLVIGGAALGFVPRLPQLAIDPQHVLVIVLPPILYQAALFTSWRDFRAELRAISLLAIGLVAATTIAIAATSGLLGYKNWGAGAAFGAPAAGSPNGRQVDTRLALRCRSQSPPGRRFAPR